MYKPLRVFGTILFMLLFGLPGIVLHAQNKVDLHYPIYDRRGADWSFYKPSGIDFPDSIAIQRNIDYNAQRHLYYVHDSAGFLLYRPTSYFTYQEMYQFRTQQLQTDYFKQRVNAIQELNAKSGRPRMQLYGGFFNRFLGGAGMGGAALPDYAGAIEKVKDQYGKSKEVIVASVSKADSMRVAIKNLRTRIDSTKAHGGDSKQLQDSLRHLIGHATSASLKDLEETVDNLLNFGLEGAADMTLGYQNQKTLNPILPTSAQNTGGLLFQLNGNINGGLQIGAIPNPTNGVNNQTSQLSGLTNNPATAALANALLFPFAFNSRSNFSFENLQKIKLTYKGNEDQILQEVEAGATSFDTKNSLMQGQQGLFGIRTKLKFGNLNITAVYAQDKAQTQSQSFQGGASVTKFSKASSDYDENRHFLLSQYFKDNYNTAMATLPVIRSLVEIRRIEVWVTSTNAATTNVRYITAFADLGENQPNNTTIVGGGSAQPSNASNNLYSWLLSNPTNRDPAQIETNLQNKNLQPVNDYEKTFARLLNPSEYTFNPKIGFISLNRQLQPYEVLSVAYQYTYNGRLYQVGEFSSDVGVDTASGALGNPKILFLKMLKATAVRSSQPIWQLMMKNIYSLDMTSIQKEGFQLGIYYKSPSGSLFPYLPDATPEQKGKLLIQQTGLDHLNLQNIPVPDGQFDYVEGYTIMSDKGTIIFPVLQPFGTDLANTAFANQSTLAKQYVFYPLYDTLKAIAQTYVNLDRFQIQGQAKGTVGTASSNEMSLNGTNISPGSVKITAGGTTLLEGVDYTVNYTSGTVKVINPAIINSGVPINISYNDNENYGMQQKSFWGIRADYKVNKKISVGAVVEQLNEQPFFSNVTYGDDPVKNTMYGADISYSTGLPMLTRLLNKIPTYKTQAPSSLVARAEVAMLQPGHAAAIGNGNIYIDNFEGAANSINVSTPRTSWALASTPLQFSEALDNNMLTYGMNRAKLSWYNIDPNFQLINGSNNPLSNNLNLLSDPRTRAVYTTELFPQQTADITNTQLATFDLTFFPSEKGPYNFNTDVGQMNKDGKFLNPQTKWGGIMRSMYQTDFETNNIQYVEFWVQDPFINNPNSTGGKLYLDFGNVSEDILKDGLHFYENGLSTPTTPAQEDKTSSVWGTLPVNPIQVTNAFSSNASDRVLQDVGLDGLDDADERTKQNTFLNQLQTNFGAASLTYQQAYADPSSDNYIWTRAPSFTANDDIIARYKNFSNPQGNSQIATNTASFSAAATVYPDNEDLDNNNTLSTTESYYEYEVDMQPGMDVGANKYIVNKNVVNVTYANGKKGTENWYLFRVPLSTYSSVVGGISNFQSIRFMRMYLTNFTDSVTLRFATLNLVRAQWRQFGYLTDTTGNYNTIPVASPTTLVVTNVGLTQSSAKTPVNYVSPPGIARQQYLSSTGVSLLQNEQSMSLQLANLAPHDTRSAIKAVSLDLRYFGTMSLFAHAESVVGQNTVQDGDLNLVFRIGQDYVNNYYEIKIPLKVTLPGSYSTANASTVWPTDNALNVVLSDLVNLKESRDKSNALTTKIFRQYLDSGKVYSVMGTPNLGEVQGLMVGVENANNPGTIFAEVWVDELRVSQMQENTSYATNARVDMTLADLGKISASVNTYSAGWGDISQKINQRVKNSKLAYDISLTMETGKLFPKSFGLSIPTYASISATTYTPQFNPFDIDVPLADLLNKSTKAQQDSIKNITEDQTVIKTLNFTNVRINKGKGIMPWSPSNFAFTYLWHTTEHHDPYALQDNMIKWRFTLDYNYRIVPIIVEPLKNIVPNNKWLALIRDVNLNLLPNTLQFKADLNRQYRTYIPRVIDTAGQGFGAFSVDTSYNKFFLYDRYYNMQWNVTRSISLNFSAVNNSYVDEPDGAIDAKAKEIIWNHVLNGGRNIMYQQNAAASYRLPLQKIPALDWIGVQYSYNTSYSWTAANLLGLSLGNTLQNSNQQKISGDFNLTSLYNKSKWFASGLKESPIQRKNTQAQSPPSKPKKNAKGQIVTPADELTRAEVVGNLKGAEKRAALKQWRKDKRALRKAKQQAESDILKAQKVAAIQRGEAGDLHKIVATTLAMLKDVNVGYAQGASSYIPGFMGTTQIMGQDWNTNEPGLDYVFGKQPDSNWLNQKAEKRLFSRDPYFNNLFLQSFNQTLSISAKIEPIHNFVITLNLSKSFGKEYTELFKDTLNNGSRQQHINPYTSGSFSISWISAGTLFTNTNPLELSSTFRQFEANRVTISNRVAATNPYWQALPTNQKYAANGYANGYNGYAQSVLIPAFLAAYTGTSAKTIALLGSSNSNISSNPFSGYLPKPNWNLFYTGLAKLLHITDVFTSINLAHGYHATLSMNNFTSMLAYQDPLHYNAPSFIDTLSGNYVPYYLLPNITMQEAFAPLLGIDATTKNRWNFKLAYNLSRQLSLSLVDYQLTEMRSTEWITGIGWKTKLAGFSFLPAQLFDVLQNDFMIRFDMSIRNNLTANTRLEASTSYGTSGQSIINIQPSIAYEITHRITAKLFLDQMRSTPYISTSPPTIMTRYGLQIRVSFSAR